MRRSRVIILLDSGQDIEIEYDSFSGESKARRESVRASDKRGGASRQVRRERASGLVGYRGVGAGACVCQCAVGVLQGVGRAGSCLSSFCWLNFEPQTL